MAENDVEVLKCPNCTLEMTSTKINLRVGGWRGLNQLLPFGNLGELGEELLPVTLFMCPKCGKLELMANKGTRAFIMERQMREKL